jgi:hypothetical protein
MEREGSSSYVKSLTRIANNTSSSYLLQAQKECESRPLKSPSADIHLHGCGGDQIFGKRIRDCSRDLFDPALLFILLFVVFPGRHVLLFFVQRPFEGLYVVHLAASTLYGYIEQTHELSRVNRATDALSIGPSAWYTLFFIFMHILLLFTVYTSSYIYMPLHILYYISGLN